MAKTTPGALRDVCQSLTALSLMVAKEEDLRSRLLERCLNFCAAGRVLCNRDSVACPMLPRYSMARDVLVCAALGSKDHHCSSGCSSGDLFVDLGARRNNPAHHWIAFRNIVADLFVPGERTTNEGD